MGGTEADSTPTEAHPQVPLPADTHSQSQQGPTTITQPHPTAHGEEELDLEPPPKRQAV
eukprot:NODE_5614_length_373_cov_453.290123_g4517_i0.p3 GENE.NODE_5614_length_373_cov_453.290123_g4517_i0~~NODE_5614_length_373_cov_453.290123_g4517_i0.p3  ORF type:complete len:67 (-),score=38.31 NODE_5614_length_373_cov_453.290123_g4517_i0:173-349(-)